MTHAKEPWKALPCTCGHRGCDKYQLEHPIVAGHFTKEDVERLVVCVNACKGINPEAVGEVLDILEYLKNSARAGLKEAANLLTALKRGAGEASEVWYDLRQNIDKAESLLAKAKPKQGDQSGKSPEKHPPSP